MGRFGKRFRKTATSSNKKRAQFDTDEVGARAGHYPCNIDLAGRRVPDAPFSDRRGLGKSAIIDSKVGLLLVTVPRRFALDDEEVVKGLAREGAEGAADERAADGQASAAGVTDQGFRNPHALRELGVARQSFFCGQTKHARTELNRRCTASLSPTADRRPAGWPRPAPRRQHAWRRRHGRRQRGRASGLPHRRAS